MICSFIHSFIHSFLHSVFHSFIHLFIHLFIHSKATPCYNSFSRNSCFDLRAIFSCSGKSLLCAKNKKSRKIIEMLPINSPPSLLPLPLLHMSKQDLNCCWSCFNLSWPASCFMLRRTEREHRENKIHLLNDCIENQHFSHLHLLPKGFRMINARAPRVGHIYIVPRPLFSLPMQQSISLDQLFSFADSRRSWSLGLGSASFYSSNLWTAMVQW